MTGSGVTNANGGLIMTGNVPNSRTINNPAVAAYAGVDNNNLGGGTFNNLAGATFTVEGNNDFFGGAFNNFGTLIKRAGASGDGITRFTAALNNSGLVRLESGTLSLEGSDTSAGDLDALAGTILQFASAGTHNFNAGADVTAAGVVLHAGVSPGNVNFNAGSTYTVTGTTQITGGVNNFSGSASTAELVMSGGTLGGTGAFNVSGQTTWSSGTIAARA
jgi:hypothetical protein